MRTFKYIFAFIICICCEAFMMQNKTLYVLRQPFNIFTSDNICNSYLINGEEMVKYNAVIGKAIIKYSNKRFGKITTIDATNALKILLYYRDFQQLVFLDSQLSPNGDPISLENLGYEQTDLVCSSFNNSFWIYNKQANELMRFDENSQPIAKTGNLKQLLQADLKPDFMLEHNSYLYLNCPDQGIYVFDMYGTFNKVISIKGLNSFQVNENIIFYFKDHKFCSYNTKAYEEKTMPFDEAVKNVRIEKDRIFVQYRDSVVALENLPQ